MQFEEVLKTILLKIQEISKKPDDIRTACVCKVAQHFKDLGKCQFQHTNTKAFFFVLMECFVVVVDFTEQTNGKENYFNVINTVRYTLTNIMFVIEAHKIFDLFVKKSGKILRMIVAEYLKVTPIKEILKMYNKCIIHTNNQTIEETGNKYINICMTLCDLIKQTSDVELQFVTLETIFRLSTAAGRQKQLFPEAPTLKQLFTAINIEHLHTGIRDFLNVFNDKSDKICSIACTEITLDSDVVGGVTEMNETCPLYLDCSLIENKISIFCSSGTLPGASTEPFVSWNVISFYTRDVLKTDYAFKKNSDGGTFIIEVTIRHCSFHLISTSHFSKIRNLSISISDLCDSFDYFLANIMRNMFPFSTHSIKMIDQSNDEEELVLSVSQDLFSSEDRSPARHALDDLPISKTMKPSQDSLVHAEIHLTNEDENHPNSQLRHDLSQQGRKISTCKNLMNDKPIKRAQSKRVTSTQRGKKSGKISNQSIAPITLEESLLYNPPLPDDDIEIENQRTTKKFSTSTNTIANKSISPISFVELIYGNRSTVTSPLTGIDLNQEHPDQLQMSKNKRKIYRSVTPDLRLVPSEYSHYSTAIEEGNNQGNVHTSQIKFTSHNQNKKISTNVSFTAEDSGLGEPPVLRPSRKKRLTKKLSTSSNNTENSPKIPEGFVASGLHKKLTEDLSTSPDFNFTEEKESSDFVTSKVSYWLQNMYTEDTEVSIHEASGGCSNQLFTEEIVKPAILRAETIESNDTIGLRSPIAIVEDDLEVVTPESDLLEKSKALDEGSFVRIATANIKCKSLFHSGKKSLMGNILPKLTSGLHSRESLFLEKTICTDIIELSDDETFEGGQNKLSSKDKDNKFRLSIVNEIHSIADSDENCYNEMPMEKETFIGGEDMSEDYQDMNKTTETVDVNANVVVVESMNAVNENEENKKSDDSHESTDYLISESQKTVHISSENDCNDEEIIMIQNSLDSVREERFPSQNLTVRRISELCKSRLSENTEITTVNNISDSEQSGNASNLDQPNDKSVQNAVAFMPCRVYLQRFSVENSCIRPELTLNLETIERQSDSSVNGLHPKKLQKSTDNIITEDISESQLGNVASLRKVSEELNGNTKQTLTFNKGSVIEEKHELMKNEKIPHQDQSKGMEFEEHKADNNNSEVITFIIEKSLEHQEDGITDKNGKISSAASTEVESIEFINIKKVEDENAPKKNSMENQSSKAVDSSNITQGKNIDVGRTMETIFESEIIDVHKDAISETIPIHSQEIEDLTVKNLRGREEIFKKQQKVFRNNHKKLNSNIATNSTMQAVIEEVTLASRSKTMQGKRPFINQKEPLSNQEIRSNQQESFNRTQTQRGEKINNNIDQNQNIAINTLMESIFEEQASEQIISVEKPPLNTQEIVIMLEEGLESQQKTPKIEQKISKKKRVLYNPTDLPYLGETLTPVDIKSSKCEHLQLPLKKVYKPRQKRNIKEKSKGSTTRTSINSIKKQLKQCTSKNISVTAQSFSNSFQALCKDYKYCKQKSKTRKNKLKSTSSSPNSFEPLGVAVKFDTKGRKFNIDPFVESITNGSQEEVEQTLERLLNSSTEEEDKVEKKRIKKDVLIQKPRKSCDDDLFKFKPAEKRNLTKRQIAMNSKKIAKLPINESISLKRKITINHGKEAESFASSKRTKYNSVESSKHMDLNKIETEGNDGNISVGIEQVPRSHSPDDKINVISNILLKPDVLCDKAVQTTKPATKCACNCKELCWQLLSTVAAITDNHHPELGMGKILKHRNAEGCFT